MISDIIGVAADRLLGHAARGTAPSAEELAAITELLLDCADRVSVLETLPFEVTTALLDCIPEGRLARAVAETRP